MRAISTTITQPNNHDTIMHRHPLGVTSRLRRLGYSIIDYNDPAPHVRAMKAHLRASAYEKHGSRPGENANANCGAGAINRARSFLDLSHEYDNQARSNFASEAAAFAIITAIAVAWPVIYGWRLLAGAI
jgi:hypothetical protein